MSNALVTVYIPTKNRPELLERAVKSVLAQHYTNLEIIVIDDGSSAPCKKQIAQICGLSDKIRLISNDHSQGACHARNLAITSAKGIFITGLDDDDEFLPDRIKNFVLNWEFYNGISLLCTGYKFILPGGRNIESGKSVKRINCSMIKSKNDVGNQVFTLTSHMRQIGGFDTALIACQDYDVWIRLICQYGDAVRLAKTNYIVHQEHDSPRISQAQRRIKGHQDLIEKHRSHFSKAQLSSQRFFCALYGGETNVLTLARLAGFKNSLALIKFLIVRLLSKKNRAT